MTIIKELVACIAMLIGLSTCHVIWGFETTVIVGLSIIYSMFFRKK